MDRSRYCSLPTDYIIMLRALMCFSQMLWLRQREEGTSCILYSKDIGESLKAYVDVYRKRHTRRSEFSFFYTSTWLLKNRIRSINCHRSGLITKSPNNQPLLCYKLYNNKNVFNIICQIFPKYTNLPDKQTGCQSFVWYLTSTDSNSNQVSTHNNVSQTRVF